MALNHSTAKLRPSNQGNCLYFSLEVNSVNGVFSAVFCELKLSNFLKVKSIFPTSKFAHSKDFFKLIQLAYCEPQSYYIAWRTHILFNILNIVCYVNNLFFCSHR